MRKIFLLSMSLSMGCHAFGVGVDPGGWRAETLEDLCLSLYQVPRSPGTIGQKVGGVFQKNHLYQRLDYLLGGVVYVVTDANGELDPRPLGAKSIYDCSYADIFPDKDESKMCELVNGGFRPLKMGDPRAMERLSYRLVSTGDWGATSADYGLQWEVWRDRDMRLRDPASVLPSEVVKLQQMGRKVILPGRSVPTFYRKDTEYWKGIRGKAFAVGKGYWMQPYRDGNFHQVRVGYHLEEWASEPESMVEVKDDEEWFKVGKGSSAYVFSEKLSRIRADWARYYEKPRPMNSQVSAAAACGSCIGEQAEAVPSIIE